MPKRRRGHEESTLVPGFTEVAEISVGGFSSVYRAREIDTGREVALKLLNVRNVTASAMDAFHRETVALGVLSAHPHIVTLYRVLEASDARPVLVLELCRGSVADPVRAEGALHPSDAVAIAVKVAGALETTHRADILHRDVKPQNILITQFGEPALADFGVARLQSSAQETADVFGFTTLHAAPEMLEGHRLSPATDVYELASTLYALIAGQAAFRSFDDEAPVSVILRILRDPVLPVARPGVPVALSDLLIWAMAKDPAERPQSAEAFGHALQEIERQNGWDSTSMVIRSTELPEGAAAAQTGGMPARQRSGEPGVSMPASVPVGMARSSEAPLVSQGPARMPVPDGRRPLVPVTQGTMTPVFATPPPPPLGPPPAVAVPPDAASSSSNRVEESADGMAAAPHPVVDGSPHPETVAGADELGTAALEFEPAWEDGGDFDAAEPEALLVAPDPALGRSDTAAPPTASTTSTATGPDPGLGGEPLLVSPGEEFAPPPASDQAVPAALVDARSPQAEHVDQDPDWFAGPPRHEAAITSSTVTDEPVGAVIPGVGNVEPRPELLLGGPPGQAFDPFPQPEPQGFGFTSSPLEQTMFKTSPADEELSDETPSSSAGRLRRIGRKIRGPG